MSGRSSKTLPVGDGSWVAIDNLFIELGGRAERPLVVGVAAVSCWGKTALAEWLVDLWNRRAASESAACTLSSDDFRLTRSQREPRGLALCPEAHRIGYAISAVRELIRGHVVKVPRFTQGSDFTGEPIRAISATHLIIWEGLFALWSDGNGSDGGSFAELQNMLGCKLYVDADLDECLHESVARDVRLGYPATALLNRLAERERQAEQYVLPSRRHAIYIVKTGNGPSLRVVRSIEGRSERLRSILAKAVSR